MKLNAFKVDSAKIEEGEWIDDIPGAGDLRVRVRGIANVDATRLRAKLVSAVPRDKRPNGVIDPDTSREISVRILVETILIDWQNLDDDGQAISYSKEKAAELLANPDLAPLRDAIAWAAQTVGERQVGAGEADAGN